MNKTTKEELESWDKLLDEYENKLGLPLYYDSVLPEDELNTYLTMDRNVLEKTMPEDCGQIAYRLAQFSFHVQRTYNREMARHNWADETIKEVIADITRKEYTDGEQAVAFCVLCDHIRALSFAIADGAIPGNEGRGYVLRRILRRAARFSRILDMHEPFFYKLISPLVDVMGDAYPEIKERHQHIARVLRAEEESFGRTCTFNRRIRTTQYLWSDKKHGFIYQSFIYQTADKFAATFNQNTDHTFFGKFFK